MDHVNNNRFEHILTVEDPIEFVHESKKCLINQREVHRDTLGFNEALRRDNLVLKARLQQFEALEAEARELRRELDNQPD